MLFSGLYPAVVTLHAGCHIKHLTSTGRIPAAFLREQWGRFLMFLLDFVLIIQLIICVCVCVFITVSLTLFITMQLIKN